MQAFFILTLCLVYTVSCGGKTLGYSGGREWRSGLGLNPQRAPGTPVEVYILDAMTCRDNYRIATKQVNDELAVIMEITKDCGTDASRGLNYTLTQEKLSPFQKRVFALYGYTLEPYNGTFGYNITWELHSD